MFNRIVRELKEVKYVSVLEKNQISISALEAKRYKLTIVDGTVKFTYMAIVISHGVWP